MITVREQFVPCFNERVDKIMSCLTFITEEIIMPIGLALIVYSLMSVLTLITEEIMASGLALIVYSLVSVLTLIAEEIMPVFGIDSLLAYFCVDIDS